MKTFASISARLKSGVIDYSLVIGVQFSYVYLFGEPDGENGYTVHGITALPPIIIWFLYFPVSESFTGRTIGKKIVGTRAMTANYQEISFATSVVRHLFDVVDLFFAGLVGILVMRGNERRQRVGDLVAGTVVVQSAFSCPQCHTELELTASELRACQFVCPKCGYVKILEGYRVHR